MTADPRQVLETAQLAARAGGQLALARLGQTGYEKRKGPRDVQVPAALEIQARVVDVIRAQFPNDHFLLEEADGPQDERADPLWIIDPLDGSLNYLHGIPVFAISIAYRVGSRYLVGVVYDPCRDELFHAIDGGSAFLNERVITVDAFSDGREAWEQAVLGTDWRGSDEQIRKALRLARFVAVETFQIITLGSPALGLCYVAAGRLHGYYGLDTLKLWDVAAGAVILKAAGGILTNAQGASWRQPEDGYLASNNIIHGWMNRIAMTVLSLPGSPLEAAAVKDNVE
ncbi:MAG: inositol monophosphatase [Anaerolineales bacterium]|nr:inositol monophosphatase [Anaerolineales bacterium]